PNVERVVAKATSIATSNDRQKVVLSNDETISARLVVIANGLNVGLRHMLGVERHVHSPCHSISIGFDMAPLGRNAFPFPALTYLLGAPERPHPLSPPFPDGCYQARKSLVLPRPRRPLAARVPPRAGGDAERSVAGAEAHRRPFRHRRRGQDPPRRSLRQY